MTVSIGVKGVKSGMWKREEDVNRWFLMESCEMNNSQVLNWSGTTFAYI